MIIYGVPTGTTPTQTKLTAYNGTPIVQHGVCSIKCSYGGKETNARFYVADVNNLPYVAYSLLVNFNKWNSIVL